MNRDSHNDVIRKAAISYYGSVKNEINYNKLIELTSYGGTTWDARPEAVNQIAKYAIDKPETIEMFIELFNDNTRSVRRNAVRQIGRYGAKKHLDALDELLVRDPILEREIRNAKKSILKPSQGSENDQEKEINELTRKLDNIRKILN